MSPTPSVNESPIATYRWKTGAVTSRIVSDVWFEKNEVAGDIPEQ